VLLAVVLKYLFLDTEPSQKAAERASPVSQPTRPFTQQTRILRILSPSQQSG